MLRMWGSNCRAMLLGCRTIMLAKSNRSHDSTFVDHVTSHENKDWVWMSKQQTYEFKSMNPASITSMEFKQVITRIIY
jgi:hypothetical protein